MVPRIAIFDHYTIKIKSIKQNLQKIITRIIFDVELNDPSKQDTCFTTSLTGVELM